MHYKFSSDQNFEDLASGRVLYHQSGMTNFPVRLAQEIFQRSLSYLDQPDNLHLYDCCCGGGYLLTVLGLLNQGQISRIVGSDNNPSAIRTAEKNLSLLDRRHMDQRISELEQLIRKYGKKSHLHALASAHNLRNQLRLPYIETQVFTGDIFDTASHPLPFTPDIIMTDVPYGLKTTWHGDESDFIQALLQALLPLSGPETVIAISMDKKQKGRHQQYRRLEKQMIGKRRFEIYRRYDQ